MFHNIYSPDIEMEYSAVLFQKAIDAIPDGVAIIDSDYMVRLMNRKGLHIYGQHNVEQVIGKPCYAVFHQRTTPCEACPAQYAFRENKIPPPVDRIVRHPKGCNTYRMSIFPLSQNGQVKLVLKYIEDCNKDKALQEKLFHAEKLATLGMLAGKIHHEINNHLTNILGMVQLMVWEPHDGDHLSLITKEVHKIKKLTQSFNSLSRPSASKRTNIVLNDLIDQVLSITQEVVFGPLQGCRIEREYLPNSPVVYGDSDKIEQIFLNLIINASQAVQKKGIYEGVLTVGTKISPDGKYALGYVQDNGCGIAEEDKAKIFDPFFTTKGVREGTGLGLSIVKDIVDMHDGLIEVESKADRGTTFNIYLPVSNNGAA